MTHYDVVIIGGSLAGSACLRELHRLGVPAVALERDAFPRDKVCGGFLSGRALSCLDQLGVLGAVQEIGAVPVDRVRIHSGNAFAEFPLPQQGMGISRSALDRILADIPGVEQGCAVQNVEHRNDEFIVTGDSFEVSCRVLIDAAGKLSRFTRRHSVDEFGIQYYEPLDPTGSLDIEFFEDGYGGFVSVEGQRSNHCFLIRKDRIHKYVRDRNCLVTGPLAYRAAASDYIAIGDAAGMIDPFCGEGMRHALDSGMIAARVVAEGLRKNSSYNDLRRDYGYEWQHRWSRKRALAAAFRMGMDSARRATRWSEGLLRGLCRVWLSSIELLEDPE